MQIKDKHRYKHRRRDQLSSSESEYSSEHPRKTQEVYDSLRKSLSRKDHKQIYNCIKNLSSGQDLGILRITVPTTFSFQKNDIEQFFELYGRIQNIIIKQPKTSEANQNKKQIEGSTNIAYIIFSHYYSAVIALKVLQSVSQKQKIVDAKICVPESIGNDQQSFNPMLGQYSQTDFVVEINNIQQIQTISDNYLYIGTIGIDLDQTNFNLRQRIIGAQCSNFLRVLYYCEKTVRLQNEVQTSKDDLIIKLIKSKDHIQRSVLVMTNSVLKYNTAMRYLHELFEQIVQQYKNSREKTSSIIPKDVHIRRWQKFRAEPTLKFIENSDEKMSLQ